MTRSKFLLFGLLACLVTVTLVPAAPTTAQGNLTVGDFVALVASRMSPDGVVRSVDTVYAAEVLRKSGIKIKTDLSSPLTEADAADLFHQFGITLQVERPGALLGRDRAEALVGVFGSTLTAATNNKTTAAVLDSKVNSQNTAASSSVRPETATTLIECQQLQRCSDPTCLDSNPSNDVACCNPCMACCKNDLGLTGKTCGHACQKRNLVTTPSDPTP